MLRYSDGHTCRPILNLQRQCRSMAKLSQIRPTLQRHNYRGPRLLRRLSCAVGCHLKACRPTHGSMSIDSNRQLLPNRPIRFMMAIRKTCESMALSIRPLNQFCTHSDDCVGSPRLKSEYNNYYNERARSV